MTTDGPPGFDLSGLGGEDSTDDREPLRPKAKYYGDIGDDYLAPDRRSPYTQRDNGLLPATNPATGFRKPKYETANDEDFRLLQNLGPEQLAEVQEALGYLGLIKPTAVYRRGVVDATTRKAFQQILGYANQNGFDDWSEAMHSYAQSVSVRGDGTVVGPGGSRQIKQGNVVQLTDGATLEQQIQQSARSRLGRKLRTNEAKRFAEVYNGMERKDGAQAAAAQDAAALGADSTITRAPSPDAAAGQYIDSQFGQEQAGFSTLGYLDALKGLVG